MAEDSWGVPDWQVVAIHKVGGEALEMAEMLSRIPAEDDPLIASGHLEGALVHGRCLIEFLIGCRARTSSATASRRWSQSDIRPGLFLASWAPDAAMVENLEPALSKLDTLLSHLSLERVEVHERIWDPRGMADAIIKGLLVFSAHLAQSGSLLPRHLTPYLARSRELLEPLSRQWTIRPETLWLRRYADLMILVPVGESGGKVAAWRGRLQRDGLLKPSPPF